MSNPTFVQCSIILPGACLNDDMGAFIENDALGERIYSVTRDEMIRLAESNVYCEPIIQIDSKDKLTETLFIITSMTEIRPRGGWGDHEWLVDYMAEVDWQDLNESNMKALYDIAMKYIGTEGLNDPFTQKHFHVGASFIVDWTIGSSTDYWAGYSEIDLIDVEGETKIVSSVID